MLCAPLPRSRTHTHNTQKQQQQQHQQQQQQQPADATPPPPPRIVNTSRVGLKTQKRLVPAVKAADSGSDGEGAGSGGGGPSRPVVARKFRRPKPDKDVQAARAAEEEAANAAFKGTTSVTLRGLHGSRDHSHPPVLLVDGYNIVFHAARVPLGDAQRTLPPATRAALVSGVARTSLEAAREALLHDMCDYSIVAGVKTVVAWDAMYRRAALARQTGLPAAALPGLERAAVAGVECVFCGDRDADAFVISEASRLAAAGAPRVLVASSDTEVQMSLDLAAHTGYVSAGMFLKDVARTLAVDDHVYAAYVAPKTSGRTQLRTGLAGGKLAGLTALRDRLRQEEEARWEVARRQRAEERERLKREEEARVDAARLKREKKKK